MNNHSGSDLIFTTLVFDDIIWSIQPWLTRLSMSCCKNPGFQTQAQ